MMTNHTTATCFTEQQIGSKNSSDKMYNGCLKHAANLIPERTGKDRIWQQTLQVAMVTETVWYAREAKS